jgi:hypothetical protein
MSKVKDLKNKIKSKIEAIKKINDDPNFAKIAEGVANKYIKDLPDLGNYQQKIGDFLNKAKKKRQEKTNIFGDIIDILDSVLQVKGKVEGSSKLMSKERLKKHAYDAVDATSNTAKQIILDAAQQVFFAGDGLCGGNLSFDIPNFEPVKIKPKEIDFFNMLSVSPTTNVGKVMYEPSSPNKSKTKFNRDIYNNFTSTATTGYNFDTLSNRTLFNMKWNGNDQEFSISGLTQGGGSVEDFFSDYYSTIEFPDLKDIAKTALLMTLQGDDSDTASISVGMSDVNRLLDKLFCMCRNNSKLNQLVNQNAVDLFNETDEDIDSYFDFDDVDGIDLDDEDARYRKVMRFKDCNNFEVPINNSILEDFAYFSDKKTLDDAINSALNKTASDAFEQSGGSFSLQDFQLSIGNLFILSLPKALVTSLLSPKIFLPIVIAYKFVQQLQQGLKAGIDYVITNAKEMMRRLRKFFDIVITKVFWKFLSEFWKRVKPDVIRFVIEFVVTLIKKKFKRYWKIITALIALLIKILEMGFDNCYDIFNAILSAISGALNLKSFLKIPNPLLMFAGFRQGFSEDRAYVSAIEKMDAAGINTNSIYGESNDFVQAIYATITAHTEEHDLNGITEVTNAFPIPIIAPAGPTVAIIPPGMLNLVGINRAG